MDLGGCFGCLRRVGCATAGPIDAVAVAAQTYASSWDTYKIRLAALARQQGVRESTIQANVSGLTVNSRVIELERTEPVAHTFGGVVGALAPYLRTHVSSSLISRGQANYRNNYSALSQHL